MPCRNNQCRCWTASGLVIRNLGCFYFYSDVQDTIKTRLQTSSNEKSSINIARSIVSKEGIRGLYRGGLPLLIGGGFFRSAQFGVHNFVLTKFKDKWGSQITEERLFGVFNVYVAMAGFAGGLGRGMIEGPVEFIKVRRQVEHSWKFSELTRGFGDDYSIVSFVICC